MLIKCPECNLQVSDRARSCPHCGYPLKEEPKEPKKRKNNKRKRLPNGFGQISEIKGQNLREPFRAMVTIGKNSVGRPICKPLKPKAYFKTYNEAYEALLEYNRNPYDLKPDITVKQLYGKWSVSYFENLKSESSIRTITSAWKYCSEIYDMRVKDVRARHVKGCMEEGKIIDKKGTHTPTANIKGRIKSIFNLMLDYAVEYELVNKNYARTFDISGDIIKEREDAKREHIAFSDEDMKKLWAHADERYVKVVLIQCYMGWRPQELGLIELEKVNLEKNIIIGGIKTEAGTDRPVPICSLVLPFVQEFYDEAKEKGSKYLLNCFDGKTHRGNFMLTYDKYRGRFMKIVEALGLNPEHRAHDPRKQFVTMCKRNEVDQYAIKYMVGHKIDDITEAVYTERGTDWLASELKKIESETFAE